MDLLDERQGAWVMRLFQTCGLCLLILGIAVKVAATPIVGRLISVSDGDTVVVRTATCARQRIRMLGLDAPEIAHGDAPGQEPWGTRARMALQQLVANRRVRIEPGNPATDKYGRLLALIFTGDSSATCANLAIVAAGLALAYPRGVNPEWARRFRLAEQTARAQGLAIWQRPGGLIELPGDYRRRARGEEREPPLAR
jgi:micrococcal nuclease